MITAPFPSIWGSNYFCPYGVEEHIPAELEEVVVLIDDDRLESALENMASFLVSPVILLGVDAVEMLHATGKVAFRGFNDQVVMIVHQAIAMAYPVIPRDGLPHEVKEIYSVRITSEYLLPGIATGGDVVEGAGVFDAERTGHGG